jgi:hypothetical protein
MKIVLTDCLCSACQDQSAAGKFYRFMVDFWATLIIMGVMIGFWLKLFDWTFAGR